MTPASRQPCSAARFYAYWILALGAAVAAFCSYIHVRHRIVERGYDLARERAIRARLEDERRDLEVELASFEAPADLARIARDQLGLDVPGNDQVIDVGDASSQAPALRPLPRAPVGPPPQAAAPPAEPVPPQPGG